MSTGIALADLIHPPAWTLVQVPPDRWSHFTALRFHEHIEMWTQSDLLDDEIEAWCEHVGGNGNFDGYLVQLHCAECQMSAPYEASYDDDTALDTCGAMYQLEGLDGRMRPFIEQHQNCRIQGRLWT